MAGGGKRRSAAPKKARRRYSSSSAATTTSYTSSSVSSSYYSSSSTSTRTRTRSRSRARKKSRDGRTDYDYGGGSGYGSYGGGRSKSKSKSKAGGKKGSAKGKGKARDKKKESRRVRKKVRKVPDLAKQGRTDGYYFNVNRGQPRKRFDIAHYKLKWGSFERYKIYREKMIGRGGYGEVYIGKDRKLKSLCAIKTIKPEKEKPIKIKQEVKMLKMMQDGPNVVRLLDLVRNPADDMKMLVFEFVKSPPYKDSFKRMKDLEARKYLYEVLRTLHYTHSKGIIHRDIKPANILYIPKTGEVRVIDWGFAIFYFPKVMRKRCGTRPYMAPELFLQYKFYDYAVDMWAFGCILGQIIFKTPSVLFRAERGHELERIARELGTDGLHDYCAKYNLKTTANELISEHGLSNSISANSWVDMVDKRNVKLATADAIDLLDKILRWDHADRITSKDALAHPYFDPVRGMGETSCSSSSTS